MLPASHNVLPRHLKPKESRMSRRRNQVTLALAVIASLAAVLLIFGGKADAAVKPATLAPAKVPCKQCHYVADHRSEVDHTVTPRAPGSGTPNGGAGGWQKHQWEMLTGFTGFRISKVGRVHVYSNEWLGQDEYGPHAFNQVMSYVRKATPDGKTPVQPRIVGGKVQDPTRVTEVTYYPRFATHGAMVFTTKPGAKNYVGERIEGLEAVFVADNRGTYLTTIVTPMDVSPAFVPEMDR